MKEMENLQNKGWEQMSALLDSEMPVKKRRTRFLWIPLLLGALAIGGASAMYIQNIDGVDNTPTRIEMAQDKESLLSGAQESATQEDQAIESVSSQNDEPNFKSTDLAARADPASAQSESNETNESTAVANVQGRTTTESNSAELPGPVDSREQVAAVVESIEDDNESDPTYEAENQQETTTFAAVDIEQETRELNSVTSLTSIEKEPLVDDSGPTSPIVSPMSQKFSSQWGMDAYLATHVLTPTTGLRGIELGLLANVTMAPRLKLNMGVGYGHYNNEGLIEFNNFSDDEALVLDPGGSGGPNQDTMVVVERINLQDVDYDTALLISERFDYLHLPVFVEYRINKWLNVTGGLRVSYLLSAPPASSSQRILYPTTFNSVADNQVARGALLDESILRRWDFAPMVGLSADIGRRLAVDVQYQMGLVPYIDRPAVDRKDYNRSLSLGLRVKLL